MSRFGLERGLPAIETKRRHIGLKEAAGSGGKAAQQAKAQADLLAKAQGELESSQAELVKVTEQAQSALAMAKARAKEEMQGASEEIKTAKSRNEYLQMRNEKIRLALIDSTEEVKKLDKHTKELQAELVATNEKLALALEEKATAIRALVQSGEKSPAILKTADGHDEAAAQVRRLSVMNEQAEATKAAQEVQEAFQVKWAGAKAANAAERALNVVDVCGRQAVYALGRGNFAIHTFEPGEVVPRLNLTEQQKNGVQR
jgi:chromosome segregation ATPase